MDPWEITFVSANERDLKIVFKAQKLSSTPGKAI